MQKSTPITKKITTLLNSKYDRLAKARKEIYTEELIGDLPNDLINRVANSFLFSVYDWICIIRYLNHQDYHLVVEIYRANLRFCIAQGYLDEDELWKTSEYARTCLDLWSRAPAPRYPKPPMNFITSYLSLFQVEIRDLYPNDVDLEVPTIRRGKYSNCPYCDNCEPCHLSKYSECSHSKSTPVRCLPMFGCHFCNKHGSMLLLKRGSKQVVTRKFKLDDGRLVSNFKWLQLKENFDVRIKEAENKKRAQIKKMTEPAPKKKKKLSKREVKKKLKKLKKKHKPAYESW